MNPVRCGDCRHFVRSTEHPEQGMGRCWVEAKTRSVTYMGRAPSLWPFSERYCEEFSACA